MVESCSIWFDFVRSVEWKMKNNEEKTMIRFWKCLPGLLLASLTVFSIAAEGQETIQQSIDSFSSPIGNAPESYSPAEFIMSEITWDKTQEKAFLEISLMLKDGHQVSALEQDSEDAPFFETIISLEPSSQFELTGKFVPKAPPLRDSSTKEIFGYDWLYHEKLVVWKAAIQPKEGIAVEDLVIVGKLRFVAPTAFS